MSYRVRSLVLSMVVAGPAFAADPDAARSADWLTEADAAARPVTYAAVPVPPAMVGTAACLALVVGLRLSRHRRWVTLR